MDWGAIIITALISSSFTVAIVVGLGYLASSLIERWINMNLEKHKAELQAENIRELERLRTELKISAFEHEIRYSKLYEKQAVVIAEFYKQVAQLRHNLNRVANTLKNKKEKGLPLVLDHEVEKEVVQSYITASDYFNENRLYFTEHLSRKLGNYLIKTLSAILYFSFSTKNPPELDNSPLILEETSNPSNDIDILENAINVYDGLQEAMRDIELEFRTLLGHTSKTEGYRSQSLKAPDA